MLRNSISWIMVKPIEVWCEAQVAYHVCKLFMKISICVWVHFIWLVCNEWCEWFADPCKTHVFHLTLIIQNWGVNISFSASLQLRVVSKSLRRITVWYVEPCHLIVPLKRYLWLSNAIYQSLHTNTLGTFESSWQSVSWAFFWIKRGWTNLIALEKILFVGLSNLMEKALCLSRQSTNSNKYLF